MTPHFQVYRDKASEFRWRYVAGNGKTLADSGEGYTRESDCEEAIETLLDHLDTTAARHVGIVRDTSNG